MKILTTLIIALLLAGCAAFSVPDFDNHAYGSFVNLHTHSVLLKEDCENFAIYTRLFKMKFMSTSLVTYAENIPNNTEITEMAKIVDNDIKELMDRAENGGMSVTYCELKADQLTIKLDTALDSVGAL